MGGTAMYTFFYAVFCFVATAALGGIVELMIGSMNWFCLLALAVALTFGLIYVQLGKRNSTVWDGLEHILEYPDNCPKFISSIAWRLTSWGLSRLKYEPDIDDVKPSEYRKDYRIIKNLWKPVGVKVNKYDDGKPRRTVFNLVVGKDGRPYYELARGEVEIEYEETCMTFDEENVRELYKALLRYCRYDFESNPYELDTTHCEYENKKRKVVFSLKDDSLKDKLKLTAVQGEINSELSLTQNDEVMFIFMYTDKRTAKRRTFVVFDNQASKICKAISARLRGLD